MYQRLIEKILPPQVMKLHTKMRNSNLPQSIILALFLFVNSLSFSNNFNKSVTINKELSGLFAPIITSYSPISGTAGTEVIITGSGFTNTSTVSIGLTNIAIQFVSPTELKIIIPCGLASGDLAVDGISAGPFTYISPTLSTSLGNLSYCVGTSVPVINLAGTPSGTTFNWTNSNTSIGLVVSGTGTSIPSFTAANSTLEPITSSIIITPTINGCLGEPKNYTITINPLPVVKPISNISVCAGVNINQISLSASSPTTVSGTTFSWTGINNVAIGLNTSSGTTSPIPAFTAVNSTSSTLSSVFTVTPTYETCIGNPINFTINVAPQSNGGTLSGSASVCSGQNSGSLSVSGIIGSIVRWEQSTDGTNWTPIAYTSAAYTSESLTTTTLFRVAVQNSTCPIAYSNAITITVNSLPTITGNLTVCSGATTALTGSGTAASTNAWSSSNTSMATVSSTGLVTGISAGAPIITYTNSNGCKSTTTITVNALPTKPTLSAIHPDCLVATGTVQFSGLPTSVNWTINPGGYNSSGATYSLSNQLPGTYTFSVSDSNLCASLTSTITINAAPIIPAIPSVGTITQPTCTIPSGSVVLNGLPLGNWTITELQGGQTYSNITSFKTIDNLAPGIYSFTVSNGLCTSASTGSVTIIPIPTQSAPTIGIPVQPTCTVATGSVTLTNLPDNWTLTPNIGLAFSGSGSSTQISGLAAQTYNYTVKNISSNCVSSVSSNVVIGDPPFTPSAPGIVTPQFFITGDKVSDLQVPSGIIKWYSALSGGSQLNSSTTLATGNYYASETFGSCESSRFEAIITVDPPTNAGIVNAVGVSTVCSGDSADLILSGQLGSVLKWQSSSDNSTWNDIPNTSGTITYTATNLTSPLYFFRAVVQSSVSSILYSTPTLITVNTPSNAGDLTATNSEVCKNALGGTITLNGNNGTVVKWQNSTDGGSSWTDIVSTATVYTVPVLSITTAFRAVVRNGVCPEASTTPVTITIKDTPVTPALSNQLACIGETKVFGTSPGNAAYDYKWTSNSRTLPNNIFPTISILFDQAIQEDITLTISPKDLTNSCVVSGTFTVVTNLLPNAEVSDDKTICVGNPIFIGANSVSGSTYSWTSTPAAGVPLLGSNPLVTPAVTTTYILEETVTNTTCKNSNQVVITVEPDPTSTITTASPSTICETQSNVLIEAIIANNYSAVTWEVVPASAGNLIVLPTPNNNQVQFTPTAAGIAAGKAIVRHTLTNTCGVLQSPVDFPITIQRQATVDAGLGVTTCDINPIQLDGTASVNATTYSWTLPTNITGSLTPANSATPTYTPSAADVANYTGPIPFTLNVGSGSACSIAGPSLVYVTIIKKPIISAGPATTSICEDTTYTVLDATVDSNTASYSWKTSGDGGFTNPTSINPIYTPGVTDIATGTATITLEAIGNFPCSTITSQTVINITKKPILNYSNQVVCGAVNTPITIEGSIQNAGIIEWTTTDGSGSFDDSSIQNPHYTPLPADMNKTIILRVRVYNQGGCDTSQYTEKYFNFTINAQPIVSAGIDKTICEGQTYTLDTASSSNASITWSALSGTFNDITQTKPIYTPNATDTSVTLTITGTQPGCTNPATDNMVLTIQKNPVANAGLDKTICQGETIYFSGSAPNAVSQSWTQGLASGILYQSTTLSPNYVSTTTESGTFTFTLTAQPDSPTCNNPSVSTTKVTVVAKPTAYFDVIPDSSKIICESGNYFVNSAHATNYDSLVWSSSSIGGSFTGGNTLTPTYFPGTLDKLNGSVKLTLTAKPYPNCTEDAIAEMVLTITKNPVVTVVEISEDICTAAGVPVPISGPGVTFNIIASDYDTLTWDSSSGNNTGFLALSPLNTTDLNSYKPSPADIANGSVSLTLTASRLSSNCNTLDSKTILLKFIEAPQVEAGLATVTICENGTYTSTSAEEFNTASVTWSSNGSAGTIANPVSLKGMIYTPSAIDIATGSVTLTLTGVGNSCQDPISDDVVVNFENLPEIILPTDTSICESSTSYAITSANVIDGGKVTWSSDGIGGSFSNYNLANTTYYPSAADKTRGFVNLTLTAEATAECSSTTPLFKTFKLTFIKLPTVSASSDINSCDLQFKVLNATATNYSAIQWTASGTGSLDMSSIDKLEAIYNPLTGQTGSVTLTLEVTPLPECISLDASGKISNIISDSMVATFIAKPIITAIPQAAICVYSPNTTINGTTITDALSYEWTSTNGTGTFIPNKNDREPSIIASATDILNGFIKLTITAIPNVPCVDNVSKIVIVEIKPLATITVTNDLTLCMIDSNNDGLLDPKTLSATFTDHNSADPSSILWEIVSGKGSLTGVNSTTPVFQPATDTDEVKIRVSVKNVTPCAGVVFKEFTLKAVQKPVVTLSKGTDTVCSSALTYNLTGNTVLDPSNRIEWTRVTPSGTGNFGNLTTANTTYTFSDADRTNGSVTLRLTAYADPLCSALSTSEDITITIDKAPTATITSPLIICAGEPYTATAANPDGNTLAWIEINGNHGTFENGNSDTVTFNQTPNNSSDFEIQLTSNTTTACAAKVVTQMITVQPKPTIDAGASVQYNCSSQPFIISGVTGTQYDSVLWTIDGGNSNGFSDKTILNPTFTPTPAQITAGSVVLKITAKAKSPCGITSDVWDRITLNFTPAQTVSFIAPSAICEEDKISLVGTAPNSSSYSWSTSSTTATNGFDYPTALNAIYTPSALDKSLEKVTLTLTGITNSNCPIATESIEILIKKKPTANAGTPVSICQGTVNYIVNDATAANYDPSVLTNINWTLTGPATIASGTQNQLNPTIVPTPGAFGEIVLTLSVTGFTECNSIAVSTKTLTIVPPPVITIPSPKTICEGSTLALTSTDVSVTNSSSVLWTASPGTFSPTNAAATIYTPAAGQTGLVNLNLTANGIGGVCTSASRTIALTIIPKPIVNAGLADGSICSPGTFTVSDASIQNNYTSYTWGVSGPATIQTGTENSLTPVIQSTSGATGTAIVTLTAIANSACPVPVSDNFTVLINPAPIVNAGPDDKLCEGLASYQLNGSVTNASAGITYVWSSTGSGTIQANTTLQPIYIPGGNDFNSSTGVKVIRFDLVANSTNGCAPVTDFMELTIYAKPIVSAGPDIIDVCEGTSVVLSGANAQNYSSVTWNKSISSNGIFDFTSSTVNPTYSLGSADTSSVTLTISALPNAACALTQVAATDAMTIFINKKPSIVASQNETTMCAETFTLPDFVTVSDAGSILWTNTTGTATPGVLSNATTEIPIFTPSADEITKGFVNLKLTAYPKTGCSGTVETVIKVNLQPKAKISPLGGLTKCITTSPITLNFGALVESATTFYWTENGSGTITANVNALQPTYTPGPGETGDITFTLHATNLFPCTEETTATVILKLIPQPTVNAGTDATVCNGTAYNLLNANATNSSTILWEAFTSIARTNPADGGFDSNSIENPTYTPGTIDKTRGSVYLFMKATNSCSIVDDYMVLTIAPEVGVIYAGASASICEGTTSYSLQDATADNATSYSWTSSDNINGSSSSTYVGGSFNTDSILKSIYSPSPNDVALGYVYLTLKGTGSSTCPIDTSVMKLNIIKKPTVSASDIQMCISNTTGVALNGTGTNYSELKWSFISGPGYINNGIYFTGLPTSSPSIDTQLRLVATPLTGCTVNAVKEITINIQSLPIVDAGINGAICYVPGQQIAPFSIIGSSVSNESSSTWATLSPSSGVFIAGTPVIYRSYSNSCTPETLTLTANGKGACSASVVSDAITLEVNCTPPSLGSISGPLALCQGTSSVLYSVGIDSNIQTYTWQVPTGAKIVLGQGSNSITVDYGANAVSGTVSVNGINGCGTGLPSTLGITVDQRPTTGTLSGPQTVCAGTSNTYTASSIANADSYKWTLPDGSNITTSILTSANPNTISFPATGSGNLSVTGYSNNCGLGDASANYAITVVPLPTLISLAPSPICSNSVFNYTPISSDSGATITWTRAIQGGISNGSGSGNGLISETLLNTTTSVVNVNYVITMTTVNGCTKSETITVTVNPIPSLTSGTPPTAICSNGTFSYAPTSDSSGDIIWSRTTVPGISQAGANGTISSTNLNISEILTNTTSSPITISYVLTLPANANNCTGPNKIINLIVNPSPNVTPPISQVVCEGDSLGVNFVTTNSGGISSFDWTNNNTIIGLAASDSGSIPTFTMLNPSTTNQVATIIVTPWFTNGGISCSGTPQTFNISVNPTADVIQPSNQVICNGSNTNAIVFETTNTTGTTTYAWTNDNPSIGLIGSGNGTIASFTVTNTTTIPQVATIVVTPIYTEGGKSCTGSPKTFTITVNPSANLAQPFSPLVCANSSVSSIFTTTNTIGTTTYAWTNTNANIGLASSGTNSITPFTALNSGTLPEVATVEVTPTFTNAGQACIGTPKTFTITVNPSAQVNPLSSITKCKGDIVNTIAFSTANTIGTTTYSWANSNPSIGIGASGLGDIPSFTVSNSGTTVAIATITVTPTFTYNGTSCTGPVQVFTITVNPGADMIQPVNKVVCNGENTSINFTTANTGSTTTYDWSSDIAIGMPTLSGSGSIANFTATNTGSSPIVATITVTPTFTNGGAICVGLPKIFTITVNPSAEVNQPVTPLVLCNGTPTSVNFTTNNIGGTTTYTWTNNTPSIGISTTGTGSIATFPITNLGTAPLTANLSVTPTFANAGKTCSGVTKNFTITINPTAQLNQPIALVKCIGETTSPIVFTTQNTVGTITYTWTNDNTSIGLIASGTGDIPSFTTENTGTSPQVATIVVTPTFTNDGVVCTGPTKTFTITVNPAADVSQPTSLIRCNGDQSNVNFATANSGGVTSYSWTNNNSTIGLGVSSFGSIPTFTTTNTGNTPVVSTLQVTPTFTNAGKTCSGSAKTFTITVNPSAQVDQPISEVVCNGSSTTAVTFGTSYTSGVTTFAWTNSNVSIGLAASGAASIPSFTGINTGNTPQVATIVVTPTYTNAGVSCTGPSKTYTITVNPSPQVNQPTAQVICNGDTYSFNFTSANIGGTTSYTWENSNTAIGLTATSGSGSIPSFTATNSGLVPSVATITVTPTYSNGGVSCIGLPKSFTITVNPSADVIQPVPQVVCNGGSTAGITLSSLNNSGTTSYTWTNSNTSIGLPISGTGALIPSFNAVNTGNIPVEAAITVTPTYTNAGVNCAGPSKIFTITVNPTGELNQPTPQVVCNGSATTLVNFSSNNSGGATTYSWTNNNTTIGLLSGSGAIPSFNAVNTGTTPVVATIVVTPTYTNAGQACSGTPKIFTITVNPSAEVVQPLAATLCNGDTNNAINFSSLNSVGTTTYTWTNSNTSTGLGLNGSGSIPSFTAINSGTSPITSTVVVTPVYTNGGQNCSGSTKTFVISVNPSAEFNQPISQELCNGTTTTAVNFTTVNTGGTTTYSWSNSNTTIGLGANGSGNILPFTVNNSGATPQVATITVTATYTNSGKSCATTKTFTITVHPSPKATISGLNSFIVCQNDTQPSVTFIGSSGTPPYIFEYKIGIDNFTISSSGTSSIATVSVPTINSGNYIVTLVSVKDSSNSACTSNSIILPNEAFVMVQEQGSIIPVLSSTVSQTSCQGIPINPIVFDISGSATGSYATGLPAGLVQNYDLLTKTFTISGSATAPGVFNYVIHTAGSTNGCNSTYLGTLTIQADDVITLLTPTSSIQSTCAGAPIQPIAYNLGGGATGGTVTFSPHQPVGILWNLVSKVITISGTSSEVGTFTYTVNSFGICDPDPTTYSGTIEIKENATVKLVSENASPTVCIDIPLGTPLGTAIKYSITSTTSATMVLTGVLPKGVSFSPATGLFSGTPGESGSFPYTISSSTTCGNLLTGTITVNPLQSISLLSGTINQTACVNSAIDPINFSLSSGVTGVTIVPDFPPGITSIVNNGVLTISGTPTTAQGNKNYIIKTVGSCGPAVTTNIYFEIKPEATIVFGSNSGAISQSVCQSTAIKPITFTVGGGATGIDPLTLPTGLILSEASGVYTISGNPTANGTFTIPITTTGCVTSETITISNVNTAVSINLTSAVGTDNQTLCQVGFNSPIIPIKYLLVGATGVDVKGLPTGVTSSFNSTSGELTISGTSTDAGIFNYSLTTLPCGIIKTGTLKISTPISITNVIVKDVDCNSINDGAISVTIIGGANSGGLYAINWTGPNGFQQNLTEISGLEAGDYVLSGTDAIGCSIPTMNYTVLGTLPINISLASSTNVSCNGVLGSANFDITGGSGIYPPNTAFKLQYLDPSSQTLVTIIPANYYNIKNLKAGLYYLTVVDSKNCSTAPYLFSIYDYSTLKIDAVSLDSTLCADTAGKVRVTVTSLDDNLVFYYNNTLVSNVNLGNSIYELSITNPTIPYGVIKVVNSQNCSDTETVSTSLMEPDLDFTSLNLETNKIVSVNESVRFTNGLTNSTIPAEYNYVVWDFGDNSPYKVFYNPVDIVPNSSGESLTTVFHTYAIDGLFTVTFTVYNSFGCSKSITKIVTVGEGASIIVPTAFSPNQDGINDLFRPLLLGLKEVNMYIYDSSGNLVYEISSETDLLPIDWGWNGIEKTRNTPINGTYRYYIISKTIDDKTIEKAGQFILIK